MAGNSDPIFTKNGKISSVLASASRAGNDGTGVIGTDMFLAFTADATNGSFVQKLRWTIAGSANNISSTATVGRVFVASTSTGSTASSSAFIIDERVLPVVTAAASAAVANWFDVPLGFPLPAGYTILVSLAVAPAAGTSARATVFGGDY